MQTENGKNTKKRKIAVVTGGSRNIGYAIAKRFYELGYCVAILSVSENSARDASKRIDESGSRVAGFRCDVTDESSVEDALKRTHALFGGIDIIVNRAGILDLASIEEMTSEHWDNVMAINLRGTFTTIQK